MRIVILVLVCMAAPFLVWFISRLQPRCLSCTHKQLPWPRLLLVGLILLVSILVGLRLWDMVTLPQTPATPHQSLPRHDTTATPLAPQVPAAGTSSAPDRHSSQAR